MITAAPWGESCTETGSKLMVTGYRALTHSDTAYLSSDADIGKAASCTDKGPNLGDLIVTGDCVFRIL